MIKKLYFCHYKLDNLSSIKKLASQTLTYGLSTIIGRFINFLLVPLYTAVYSPHDYGIVTDLYALVAFLNIVLILKKKRTKKQYNKS